MIAVGSRLQDFSTASKTAFQNPQVEFVSINVNRFDALKMDSVYVKPMRNSASLSSRSC